MGKSTNLSAQQKAEEVHWRLYQNPAHSVHPVDPRGGLRLGGRRGVAELAKVCRCCASQAAADD